MPQPPFRRRDFLRSLAATVVVAGAACESGSYEPGIPLVPGSSGSGGAGGGPPPAPTTDSVFPQSVASGDPRLDSFIIWTRVEPEAADDQVAVEYVVAEDEALTKVVAQGTFTANADADHTVKLKVTGDPTVIKPGTHYYYQFRARGVASRVGRTKTAPAADADVAVRFAFASCQDFIGRYYHSWQALLDETSEEGKDIDFVVYLGDYIYETTGNLMFQTPDGERNVALPVGKTIEKPNETPYKTAVELADYRSLYRQYRRDPNLQKVHERFPFIIIWDDHEFADDGAQDRSADYDNATGPADEERDPARRLQATRAWVEFQPVDAPQQMPGEAPGTFKMYRTLRFGKHVELFLTDQRLFRSAPLVPEGPADLSVAKLDANTSAGSHYFLLKAGYDAKEVAADPPMTMLGAPQKEWFLGAVGDSTATWKVWGNEVQLWQMAIDLKPFPAVPAPFNDLFYFSVDQWDGFRSERAEILTALSAVPNVVAITGDVHGFFAAELHPDFDAAEPSPPVAAEFVVAGITSQSVRSIINDFIKASPTFVGLGLLDLVPQLDTLLTGTNKHLKFANSDAYGVAIVQASAAAFEVTFLQLSDVTKPVYEGDVARTVLHCAAGSAQITTGAAPA